MSGGKFHAEPYDNLMKEVNESIAKELNEKLFKIITNNQEI